MKYYIITTAVPFFLTALTGLGLEYGFVDDRKLVDSALVFDSEAEAVAYLEANLEYAPPVLLSVGSFDTALIQ